MTRGQRGTGSFTPVEPRVLARVAKALLLREQVEAAADTGMNNLAGEIARAMNTDELAILYFINRRMLFILARDAAGRATPAAMTH